MAKKSAPPPPRDVPAGRLVKVQLGPTPSPPGSRLKGVKPKGKG